ncbi:MAG TPA: prepilin-type N-terminal cleavage/methylation domain-containing protein [Verrucomicrobiae bacterium]|nr:prepilin-type N-terminal cleavage/methylation domain-containing protein [Verrucomicrobiae bacterium]
MRIRRCDGFTLVEFMIVSGIISIISAISFPAVSRWYLNTCLHSAMMEIAEAVRETKRQVIATDEDRAVVFEVTKGAVYVAAGKGPDGKWGTADDVVLRRFSISRHGAISFGYGSCGPPSGLAASDDGITFSGNYLVCNTKLTGSAGTVYLKSSAGGAMALTMNSTDFGYSLRKWDGKKWVIM